MTSTLSDAAASSRRPTLDLGALDGGRRNVLLGEGSGPTRSASLPAVATLARAPVPGQSPTGSPRMMPTSGNFRPGAQPSLSLNTALPRAFHGPDSGTASPTKASSAMTPSSSLSRLIPKPLQLTPNRGGARSRSDSSNSLVPPSPTTLNGGDHQGSTLGHRPSGLLREAKEGLAAMGLGSRGRAESEGSEQSSIGGGSGWRHQDGQRS